MKRALKFAFLLTAAVIVLWLPLPGQSACTAAKSQGMAVECLTQSWRLIDLLP